MVQNRFRYFSITLYPVYFSLSFSLIAIIAISNSNNSNVGFVRWFVRGAVYYNVECELSRHRDVIAVWNRPGFAAKPPPPPPTPTRSIQPLRPTTGPDNERVITPRWPTAVLLGRAAFLGGDYYSFYSLARAAAFSRWPRLRSLWLGHFTALHPPPWNAARCIQRSHCFLFHPSLLSLSLSQFLPSIPLHFLRFSMPSSIYFFIKIYKLI